MGGHHVDGAARGMTSRRRVQRSAIGLMLAVVAGLVLGFVPGSATPAGAHTYPSTINRDNAGLYWCTSNTDFCKGSFATLSSGRTVRMVCWKDDRIPSGERSPLWVYVFASNGKEGWVYGPRINNHTATPPCNTINWMNAADWAIAHLGQRTASTSEARNWSNADWGAPRYPVGEWSGDCPKFTWLAWKAGGGHNRGNAIDIWRSYPSSRRKTTGNPPRGALVFWNYGAFGHIAISIGNGQAIGTVGDDGANAKTAMYPTANRTGMTYLGWVMPQTPTVGAIR